MELTPAGSPAAERYNKISYSAEALDELLVDLFLEAHPRAPREIVLDLDATDTPLHGRQEARFFHGYYGHYCYLPLYVFCGDHLLCARLRPSNIDAGAGSLEEVQRIVRQVRAQWPKTSIILRADSGFCREELLAWRENNEVDYVFGFARNKRLRKIIGRAMQQAKQEHRRTGKPARVFCEFAYRTKKSWSRARRVIAKAEQLEGKENPRYLVTSLHPSGKFLFMANGPGSVATYSIDSTGAPTFVGQSASAAVGAISVAVDPQGKFVYTANVNGNTVSAYSVDTSTGSLTQIPGSPFPAGPNPFFVAVHPSGNFLYADNVNGQSVSAFTLDSITGTLGELAGSPFTVGSGPRAMALDPAGKYAFVANTNSNNMSAVTIESTTGALQPITGSPFPTGSSPDWAIVDPLGKFLYAVNLSSNNISVFAIDPASGFLTSVATVTAGSGPISMTLVK